MSQQKLTESPSEETKAHELAKKQREIGVAEFFARNRHLLGFDNKRKALLTTIKEAVDNALDACEEASILPEIIVEIIEMGDERFRVIVEDNGPGIVKAQIPKIFAKLLYGSKFHSLKQSRGQQGIGISAAVMYSQLTTGRPAKITSVIGKGKEAHYYELNIDTQTNKPNIVKDSTLNWEGKDHGTRIELDMEASYQKGNQSVDEYLKQTAITNPHATIIYTNPKAEQYIFARVVETPPPLAEEIKPHPYGVELGVLIQMISQTEARTLQAFLTSEFSRVGPGTAKEICKHAALLPDTKPGKMSRAQTEQLAGGIKKTKIIAPPTECINPIGADQFEKGLRKEINAEFYASCTRTPTVYRGNPFVIECALAYGGDQPGDKTINLLRFANRVPLQFQQSADSSFKAIVSTNFRSYGLSQSQNALPVGPCTIAIHIASVWVPFTSESKEAIAHYPEIIKEMKLALQEVGRKLASYVRKRKNLQAEHKKRNYIEKYIPHVAEALKELLVLNKADEITIKEKLEELLEHTRGKVEELTFDSSKNTDYDEEFANIGKEEEEDDKEEE